MDPVAGLGLLAGSLTTVAFLPQVIKVWRTRSASDLSMQMVVVFSSGILLWLLYGILKGDLPIIASNLATLILVVAILILKIRYS